MSDETKPTEKTFEWPMMPVYGIDISRELGSIDSRLTRVENDVQKLDAKIDVVEARLNVRIDGIDSRVNDCLVAINRMDERITAMSTRMDERFAAMSEANKSTRNLVAGLCGTVLVTVLAGIILQYFK